MNAGRIDKIHKRILEAERGFSPRHTAARRVVVAFANSYHVGMSNLALHWLYRALNTAEGFRAERVFLPSGDLEEAYAKQGGVLRTIESGHVASDARAWFVTLPCETDYPNLVHMLRMAGLSPMAGKRDKGAPFIVAGGTGPNLNPEPLALIADVILLGEGDAALLPFLDRLRDYASRPDRLRFLQSLRDIPNAYVPRYYMPEYDAAGRRIGMRAMKKFPERPRIIREPGIENAQTDTCILTPNTEFPDTLLIETFRGCSARCRFCAAGHLSLPPRERPFSRLRKPDIPNLGQKGVGLVGAGVSGHSRIENWIEHASASGRVGISSVRMGKMSDRALKLLAEQGAKSVALAPEAGTERLRRVCNKPFSDSAIIDEAGRVIQAGFLNLKLYFMVGLPTENAEDLQAIPDLAIRIRNEAMRIWRERKQAGRIDLSINPFVPKAHTPFQWAPFIRAEAYDKAMKAVSTQIKREGNIEARFEPYTSARLQAILSLGDRDASELAILVDRERHVGRGIKAWNRDVDSIIHRGREFDEVLPWDFVDSGISRRYLADEYHRALEGKISPECRPKCKLCGICK